MRADAGARRGAPHGRHGVLKRAEFSLREAAGGTMAMALRPALHGALLDAVGLERVAVGTEVVGFASNGNEVTVHTAKGGR